jgi:hypothetical protein
VLYLGRNQTVRFMNWKELYERYKNFKDFNDNARFDIMQFVRHYSKYGVVGKLGTSIVSYKSDLSHTELYLPVNILKMFDLVETYYQFAYQKASYEHLLAFVEYINQYNPDNAEVKELLDTIKDWFIKNIESLMDMSANAYYIFNDKPLLTNLTIKNFTLDGQVIKQ